jgi:hypothetical protein
LINTKVVLHLAMPGGDVQKWWAQHHTYD